MKKDALYDYGAFSGVFVEYCQKLMYYYNKCGGFSGRFVWEKKNGRMG